MSENSEFAKRPVFSGDPIDKCLSWLKAKDGAKVRESVFMVMLTIYGYRDILSYNFIPRCL